MSKHFRYTTCKLPGHTTVHVYSRRTHNACVRVQSQGSPSAIWDKEALENAQLRVLRFSRVIYNSTSVRQSLLCHLRDRKWTKKPQFYKDTVSNPPPLPREMHSTFHLNSALCNHLFLFQLNAHI